MPNVKRYTPKGLNLRDNLLNRDPAFATDVKNVQLDEEGNLVKRDGIETVVATPANAVELVACSFDFDETIFDLSSGPPFLSLYGTDANKLIFIDDVSIPKVLKADNTIVDAQKGWIKETFSHQKDYSVAGNKVQFTAITPFSTYKSEMIYAEAVYTHPARFTLYVYARGIIYTDSSLDLSTNEQTRTLGGITVKVKANDVESSQWNRAFYVGMQKDITNGISYTEYDNNLYVCNKNNFAPMMKFDTQSYYVAGVPSPAGLLGDYLSYPWSYLYELAVTEPFYVQQLLDIAYRNGRSIYPSGFTSVSAGAGAALTNHYRLVYRLTNKSSDNPIYSDYYYYGAITNNIGTTANIVYQLPVGGYYNELAYKWELLIFASNAKDYGYRLLSTTAITTTGTINFIEKSIGITMEDMSTAFGEPMENYIDVETTYLTPPFSKLIAARQNALMTIDFDNNLNWSTQALNSHVENFSALNFEIVGKQTEGSATAIFSQSSKDIIFKIDSLFFIDGSITDNYFIRKSVSNLLGCLNDKSVIPLDGGCLFCTQKGIFFTANGSEPIELSEQIEPLFSDYDFTTARSLLDSMNERVLIYVQTTTSHRVIVLDIKHKEWFVFEDIDASLGLVLDNDGDIYFCNSTSIKKLNSNAYDEVSTPISSYWKSGWENLGEPSLRKKFLNLKLFSLSNVDWTAKLSTEVDWVEGTKDTEDQELLLDSDNRFALQNLDNNMVYSMRFLIENSNKEAILLTGYEYEYEAPQRKMKG